MPDLLACPFCEGTRLKEDAVSNTNGNRRYIWCLKCSAEGPWSTKELSARDAWNRRPQLSAALQARQGWVSVPVEPTMEMMNAYWDSIANMMSGDPRDLCTQRWHAMIAAAPPEKPE